MRKWMFLLAAACLLTACSAARPQDETALSQPDQETGTAEPTMEDRNMNQTMHLSIDGTPVDVTWEDNQAVDELFSAAQEGGITVYTFAYGGFEQVGPLPKSFSRSDVQMTTVPGDIVLYSGDQIVLFYGSNSWSYTKLGHIEGLTGNELADFLDKESVAIEIAIG